MANSVSEGTEQAPDHRLTGVWVFFATTLVVSAAVVYFIGNRMDNPDAAILAVIVPSTVAIVITAFTSGRKGVGKLLRLGGSDPMSARLLVISGLGIPVLALMAIGIGAIVTGNTHDFSMPSEGLIVLLPLIIIAVGEEYGWRGYALPGLQTRYSALAAALIVGVVHWMWHYPASLINTGVPLDTPFWLFGLFVISWSIIMASIFNASTGAVGLMILLHIASNAAFVFLPLLPEQTGGELATFSIFVALTLVAALATVVINGPASLSSKEPAT
jgi:membrane protease YdiL (CAAX protease family)